MLVKDQLAFPVNSELLRCWRRQIASRRRRPHPAPRGLAALGYLANGSTVGGLIQLEKLVLIIVFDQPTRHGATATWLAGYHGESMPWGVSWGGAKGNCLLKNLRLAPSLRGSGPHIRFADGRLLEIGLQLDRALERHHRYPNFPKRAHFALPQVWAGFWPTEVRHLSGDGPEFAAACREADKPAAALFAATQRHHRGLALFPLEWTSHVWDRAAAFYVDLARFPRRQVIRAAKFPKSLQGFAGAAQFDFFTTRFGRPAHARRRRSGARDVVGLCV